MKDFFDRWFENTWYIVVAATICAIVFPISGCVVKQAEMRHDMEVKQAELKHDMEVKCIASSTCDIIHFSEAHRD